MEVWSYRYSRTMEAIAFQNRTRLSIFFIYMKSLLAYPSFDDHNLVSLSRLADELSFRIYAEPYASSKLQRSKAYVEVDVLSLGPLFGRYLSQSKESHQHLETFDSYANNGIEISGHLSTKGRRVSNLSSAFEGIYNPTVEEMYLLGCRDIRDLQRNLRNVTKLEEGKDCEIEIIVEYPPTTLKDLEESLYLAQRLKFSSVAKGVWRIPPTSVLSPSFTDPIFHKSQLNDLIMRKTFEGFLWIIMLLMVILFTWSQMKYASITVDPSQVSLVMLRVQALGFGIPLVTGNGNGILFKWKVIPTHSHSGKIYDLSTYEHLRLIESAIWILLLVSLALTLKLAQRVYESCIRRGNNHKQKTYIQREKWVFFFTPAVHFGMFLVAHATQKLNVGGPLLQPAIDPHTNKNTQKLLQWLADLDEYSGIVQDFFLLPRIIGNILWQIQGKPLGKPYYIGVTILRILKHIYDYIIEPIPEPYYDAEQYQNMDLESNSKFGNIMVAFIVIVLAFIVYLQQKSQHKELGYTDRRKEDYDKISSSEIGESLLS